MNEEMKEKRNSRQHFIAYLTERNIKFQEIIVEGEYRITTAFTGFYQCPSERIEACVFFHKHARAIEARVYYSHPAPEIIKGSEHITELYHLLNWINSNLYPVNLDHANCSVYSPSYLVNPRWYITEDGGHDIISAVVLDEDLFLAAPLEIEDYITITLPWIMGELSPFIFWLLTGEIDMDYAIRGINANVLGVW